jgi:uncharacterized membrane protein YjfL (UPF0719 family)
MGGNNYFTHMSGDEVFALIVSGIIGIVGWKDWLGGLFSLEPLNRRPATQFLGWLLPLLAGAVMFFVLLKWSSHDVRDDPTYIFFYLVMWFGWTGLWNWLLPYLGLSCRDDVLERDNSAAGLAIGGGLLGATFIFAGGNIGEGPGWWVVVFCAALATAPLLLFWVVGNQITHVEEAITIDEDAAAGWRTAGFFIGAGLILGRAVAGDWHSVQQTVSDFIAKGWPALVLWGMVLVLDWVGRPTPQRPNPNSLLHGLLPGLMFIAAGISDVRAQGTW